MSASVDCDGRTGLKSHRNTRWVIPIVVEQALVRCIKAQWARLSRICKDQRQKGTRDNSSYLGYSGSDRL